MTSKDHRVEPWEKLASEQHGDYRVYRVRRDWSRSPATGRTHDFYVLEMPDWVNVIPLTEDGQVVFIRQFRHGTEELTLEIPGGVVDARDASPAYTARRELLEETGYKAEQMVYIGTVTPNPALQDNRCHTYLALGAWRSRAPEPDDTEEIAVKLVDPAEVPKLIMAGEITHALVVAGFYLFDQYRRTSPEVQKALSHGH